MSTLPDFNLSEWLKKEEVKREEVKKEEVKKEDWVFRVYARNKAMEVWRDQPFLGVGPGMFGGVVSVIFNSPVYEKYNFSQKWYEFMKPFRSLDQFWPQVLAEIGIIGTVLFAGLLFSLLITHLIIRQRTTNEIRDLFTGFTIATTIIFIYTFGSGLNLTSLLFTYSALAGTALGGYENSSN